MQTINQVSRTEWFSDLKRLFTADEFEIALTIYSFEHAFQDGLTPKQAYDDFDRWTQE